MTRPLHEWVTLQAERRPGAVALVLGKTRLSYLDLDRAGNRLANMLRRAGCKPGDRVCLLLPKSIDAVVAIQGTLKAGCLYVPMDPDSPAVRLAHIVNACRPAIILANGVTAKRLVELLSIEQIRPPLVGYLEDRQPDDAAFPIAFTQTDIDREPAETEIHRPDGADGAHILFTSGSTGLPKGVVITHANVDAFVGWGRDYFSIGPEDRLSQHPPMHFDLSTFDIFGAFSAGAELHLIPPGLNLRADMLAGYIRDSELTQWFSVPSVLSYMAKFDVVGQGDFPHLKRLLWCGEVFRTPSLIYYMQRLPHVQFTNLYGPTEATIASSYFTVPRCPESENAEIPIGTGCGGEELLVLDDDLQPAPAGAVGDLYIEGAGLSPGYWEDPDKTRAAFIDAAAVKDRVTRIYKTGDLARMGDDGLVYFVGRADTQIKHRGYRIELGEIEKALYAFSDMAECAVVAIDIAGFEGTRICCAYEPVNGSEVPASKLRGALAQKLPGYMLPTLWMHFESLPRNQNGKIDRKLLREEALQREAENFGAQR